jgi:hypothetical protein
VLRRIAEDETRHAELGYRFVQWALGELPAVRRALLAAELRAVLASEIDAPAPTERAGSSARLEATLVAHGLLPARLRAVLRETALRGAVLPAVEALLGGSGSRLAA